MKKDYRLNCYIDDTATFMQDYANFFDAAEFLKCFKEQCEKNDNIIDVTTEGEFLNNRYYYNNVIVTTNDSHIIQFEIVGI